MVKKDLYRLWKEKFIIDPIGYLLKSNFQTRWFRLHSLKDSKRYPENSVEVESILKLQNDILEDIIGDNQDFQMFFSKFEGDYSNDVFCNLKDSRSFEEVERVFFEEIKVSFLVKEDTWSRGKRNDILKLIIEDEIRMIFVSLEKESVVYPYDGGVDIICSSEEEKEFLIRKYSKWLPK